MDKEQALSIARSYVDLISKYFGVRRAFLFGSYAKGNYHEDSDIDVAFVIDDVPDVFDAQVEMMIIRRQIDIRLEPHPFLEEDFNQVDPVAYEIMQYGIEISGVEVASTY